MTEEIEAHVLKKYEILQKLGNSDPLFRPYITRSSFLKGLIPLYSLIEAFLTLFSGF